MSMDEMARDAIAAYRTFAAEQLHPVEIQANQQTHLVQWLSGRLGEKLMAPDLTAQGYELMGGRLLPAGEVPAAMFMYGDSAGNRITLWVRADPPPPGATQMSQVSPDRATSDQAQAGQPQRDQTRGVGETPEGPAATPRPAAGQRQGEQAGSNRAMAVDQDGVAAVAWVDRDLCWVAAAEMDRPRLLAVAQSVRLQLASLGPTR